MNVFIDTNIYLDFFAFSKDKLDRLEQVLVLNRGRHLTLITTQQVKDEFARNRNSKIAESLKELTKGTLPQALPTMTAQYAEHKELTRLVEEYARQKKSLEAAIRRDVETFQLQADKTIERVLKGIPPIVTSEEVFARAQRRCATGNPPGKSGSLGDAINWEAILASLPKRADLHITAKDTDYFASIPENSPHEFLAAEYKSRIGGSLYTYKSLTAFLQQHFQEYSDLETMDIELAVRALRDSPAFHQTHAEIAILSKYSDFSVTQVRCLVQAFLENKQVYGIVTDDDIAAFAAMLWKTQRDKFAPTQVEPFQALIEEAGLLIETA